MEFPSRFKCELLFSLLAFSRSAWCSLQLSPFTVPDDFLMLSKNLKLLDMRTLSFVPSTLLLWAEFFCFFRNYKKSESALKYLCC